MLPSRSMTRLAVLLFWLTIALLDRLTVTGVSIHVGSIHPARAKRVGIQYWRMASMAAGISLWALRKNPAVSRPFLAGPSSGRP